MVQMMRMKFPKHNAEDLSVASSRVPQELDLRDMASALFLQVEEIPQAAPSQDVGPRRLRMTWFFQGMGLAALMLIGVAAMGGSRTKSPSGPEEPSGLDWHRGWHGGAVAGFSPTMPASPRLIHSAKTAAKTAGLEAAALLDPPSTRYGEPQMRDSGGQDPSYADYQQDKEDHPYDQYLKNRGAATMEKIEEDYRQFKGIDQEFDGGDSGGGVVGDGNTDLEDQHNSATLGALRGGVSDLTGDRSNVGRGNVLTVDSVKGATEARTASAGKNYFGRSTGYADKLMETFTEEDLRSGKVDSVRAQQKENWFNQRAIHASNRAQGQGVVFGAEEKTRPANGGYDAQIALTEAKNLKFGGNDGDISQRDLANHMSDLAHQPAARLDGEEWGAQSMDGVAIEETFELRSRIGSTLVHELPVKNMANTFAPYRCYFAPGSHGAFTVTPNAGTMNRRSGEDIQVSVRFTPQEISSGMVANLVFETEDFKKVWTFIGGT
jgi:hypothetical protein